MLVAGQTVPRVHAVASTSNDKAVLTRLNELSEQIFEKVNNELAGTQFMTKVGIGSRTSGSLKRSRSRSSRPMVKAAPAAKQRKTCCAST